MDANNCHLSNKYLLNAHFFVFALEGEIKTLQSLSSNVTWNLKKPLTEKSSLHSIEKQ